MARGRIISKSICHSEKLAMLYTGHKKIAEFATLLYTWIIPHTDDYGQLSASLLSLKLQVIPASPRPLGDFQSALNALQKTNLIQIHDRLKVLRIVNFDSFQTFRSDRARQNLYPDIQWYDNGKPRYDSGTPEVKGSEVKGSEVKGSEVKKPIAPSDEKESLKAGDVILRIPLIKRDGHFNIYQDDVDQWQETFPAVDIMQALRELRQWNNDNPDRRKTSTGIRKHISTWLGKIQNKGGNNAANKNGSKKTGSRLSKQAPDR